MAPTLVRMALRRSLIHVRHVKAVPAGAATGLVAKVYRQVERDFGMLAPPVGLHSPSAETLAASWMILRETLVAQGFAARADKELVATGVSAANDCPYCADVHGMTLEGLTRAGRGQSGLGGALAEWARTTGTAATASAPPVPPEAVPEVLGVAVTFHFYNRMVNLFLDPSPIPSHVPANARPKARKVLTWIMRPGARAPKAGTSLDFLPPAELPDDLAWARPNPVVADAFARAYAATEAAGARSVPASVRELVRDRLSTWNGAAPGISRAWVDELVAGLPVADQPAGRLALVIALASYQVDDGLVDDFRATAPADQALVELAGWTSMTAARRVGSWLAHAAGWAGPTAERAA